jgi:hypothetical protein
MNENLCSAFYPPNALHATVDQVRSWQREQKENQREWKTEKERRRTEWHEYTLELERQLHDSAIIRAHPGRLLWRAAKNLKALKRTLSRSHTPTRNEKRGTQRDQRKRARQFLTQRGETSAPGQGTTEDKELSTVVAAV